MTYICSRCLEGDATTRDRDTVARPAYEPPQPEEEFRSGTKSTKSAQQQTSPPLRNAVTR